MRISDRFPVGSKVRLSPNGIKKMTPLHPEREATVLGYSRDKQCVRIRMDGWSKKSAGTYHATFLERV